MSGYGRYRQSYYAAPPSRPAYSRGYNPQAYWASVNAARKGAELALSKVATPAPKKRAVAVKKAPAKKAKAKVVHNTHTTHKHTPTHSNSGIGRSIGEMAGGMIPIAGPIAEKALGWLGDKLEDGIGSLFGFGEYKVENNSLMEGNGNVVPEGGRPPQVSNAFEHDGSAVIIKHQEPLGDIITSAVAGEFKLQNFFIQPGVATSFPWLAAMAQNFQQYRILGMLFEFRSMAADAISGTNIALGTVTMATNYNASSGNYVSKKDMQNSEYATSTKPSLSVFHPIECDPKVTAQDVLYIRNGAVPADDDQRLYDWGNFQIATSGFQGASVTIGELWVTYDIALIKPKAVSTTGSYILANHMSSSTYSDAFPFLGFTTTASSTLNVTVSSSGSALKLDRTSGLSVGQKFMFTFHWRGTVAATISLGTFTLTGLVAANGFFYNDSTTSSSAPLSVSSNRAIYSTILTITDLSVDPQISVSACVLPSGGIGGDVVITQVPTNYD